MSRKKLLVFTFSKIPFNQSTRWLMHHFTSKGRYIEFLKLDGEDSAGQRISTDYFIMTGYNSSNNTRSSFFTPKGSTKWLQVSPKSSFDRSASMTVTVRYDIVGIQGFGQQNAMSELGNIRLGAASRVDIAFAMAGQLSLKSPYLVYIIGAGIPHPNPLPKGEGIKGKASHRGRGD